MSNRPLCNACDRGECHHFSEDDGATQQCGMPVDGDNVSCDCGAIRPRSELVCVWCAEPLDAHMDECPIALKQKIAALESRNAALVVALTSIKQTSDKGLAGASYYLALETIQSEATAALAAEEKAGA